MANLYTAQEGDLFELIQLEEEIFPQDAWPPLFIKSLFHSKGVEVRCLKVDDQIVAALWLFQEEQGNHLLSLGVRPEFRRQGMARQLLLTVSSNRNFRGETRASNKAMQELFLSLGFHRVSVSPNYYENPREAAWVYLRNNRKIEK